jgi:hypothetical protein
MFNQGDTIQINASNFSRHINLKFLLATADFFGIKKYVADIATLHTYL